MRSLGMRARALRRRPGRRALLVRRAPLLTVAGPPLPLLHLRVLPGSRSSPQEVARRRGAMGGCQPRTQAAFISIDMGAAEDDCWRRPVRPGDSALLLR